MRKLFLALFVLCSFFASAQKIQKVNTYGYEYNRFISDTLFALPGDTFAVPAAYQSYPFLARKATTLYLWNTVTFIWEALAGGVTSVYRKTATDSVFQVINNVPVYAFKDSSGGAGTPDSTVYSTRAWRQKGDDSLGAVINLKLNISDTANMRVRLAAGSNITLTGTYPYISIAASGGGTSDSIFNSPLVGDLYNKSHWNNLSDFIDTATYFSVNSSGHIVATANTDPAVIIKLNKTTQLDIDSVTVRFIWVSGTGGAPSVFYKSTNTTVAASCSGGLNLIVGDPKFGSVGFTNYYTSTTHVSTANGLSTSTVGDTITLTMSNRSGLYTLTATNESKGISFSYSVQNSYTYGGAIGVGHNTSRVGFTSYNATFEILKFQHATDTYYKPLILVIGDSKAEGAYADSSIYRYANLLGASLSAGGGDKTAEVLSRLDELLSINPQYAIIDIGANDIFQGISSGTWQANYAAIVAALEARNIIVYKCAVTPSDGASMLPIRTWLLANYPSTTIDLYTALLGSGTGLNPIYNAGDGTHLNRLANRKIDTLIRAAMGTLLTRNYIDQYIGGDGVKITNQISGNNRYRTISLEAASSSSGSSGGITALTGDVTASGTGSVAATLATVNSNVGSFTNANITVNAKGLITAASTTDMSIYTRQQDTVTQATFTGGARFEADTAAFTTSTIYGSFFWDGSDTLIITKINAVMNGGTSDTLGYNIYYNDSINVIGTNILTATEPVNSVTVGNWANADNYATHKIPPGNWVWLKTPTVVTARKPYYFSVSIIGYKKRVY